MSWSHFHAPFSEEALAALRERGFVLTDHGENGFKTYVSHNALAVAYEGVLHVWSQYKMGEAEPLQKRIPCASEMKSYPQLPEKI